MDLKAKNSADASARPAEESDRVDYSLEDLRRAVLSGKVRSEDMQAVVAAARA